MFADFQEAVVIVAGDGIFTIAAFTLAGAILLGIVHVLLGGLRRYFG